MNEEYAIGVIGLEESIIEDVTGIPKEYLEKETDSISQQLKVSIKNLWTEMSRQIFVTEL